MTAHSEPNIPGIDDGDGDGDPHSDGRRSNFITQWAQAIADTSYVSMGTAQLEAFAADLTADLTGLLRAPSYDTAAGRRIGAALVAAHCTGPETLSRSLMLLSERLSEVRRLSSSQRPTALDLDRRVSRIIGDIAGGYAAALRDRTLAEQDEICRAVFATQRAAEQQLAFSEARFRAMFTEAATGIGIADLDGNILEANPALLNMFGYSAEAFAARKVSELVHPDDAPDVWEIYEELIAGTREDFHVEKRFFRADGEAIWTNLTVSLIRDDTGNPTYQIAMLEDITERRYLLARLQHQAFHDPLTGLANRALFAQRLETALSGAVGCRVGLCYLDLDGFKTVNDTLGHHHGDKLLIRIAARLEQCCPGAMVARIGGDEFVIFLENTTSTAEVIELAEKVQATLSTPFRIGTHELLITTSIGIVEQPVTSTNAVDLMTAADTTLYRAKNEGKNRYAVFDRARTQTEVTRFTLAAAMPAGIRRGEFLLDYQPLVTLSDESWSGVEALVRWQHPTFGRLAPSRFINLAEETGAIVPLGRWVLQQACQQAAHWWRTHGDHAPVVSVNLAPSQLRDSALIDDIATILQETGLPAGHLQLELTEHAVMRDEPASLCTLNTLHDMKVRIVIDDFGTGYSNMSYLHRLPLCGLKLDASFIRELDSPSSSDPPGAKIVSALITLAHNLKLTVTAEGVETRTQLDRLRALGCDTAQGWLFGPAGPAELITQHLAGLRPMPDKACCGRLPDFEQAHAGTRGQ